MVKKQVRAKSAPKSIKVAPKVLSKKSSKASSTKKVSVASSPVKSTGSKKSTKNNDNKPKWNPPTQKLINIYPS